MPNLMLMPCPHTTCSVLADPLQQKSSKLTHAGESYAGVYVPTLAQEVLRGNAAGHKPEVNLQVISYCFDCCVTTVCRSKVPP